MTHRRLPNTKPGPRLENQRGEEVRPACEGNSRPYDLLHDYISGPIYNAAVNEARTICGTCPLQQTCLRENRDTVWVQALIRGPQRLAPGERLKQAEAACGTDSGYYRHIRGTKTSPKSKPCEACRLAHNAANRGDRTERHARTTCRVCGCLLKPGEACPNCALADERWEGAA